MIELEMIGF